MTVETDQQEQTEQNGAIEKPTVNEKLAKVDMGQNGFLCRTMDEAWRFAQFLSQSQFVPQTYQGKPGDCLVAIDMAQRLKVAPLMFLQNTYVVYGRPGMEAKLVITLINQSGLFTDPLDYEVVGDDPAEKGYKVRAFAARKNTGKVLYGPWITWDLVKAEGWESKQGSKWKTMPEVMFAYRAASWFANRHCPEVKMGMMTADELEDEGPKHVQSRTLESTNGERQKWGFDGKGEPPAEKQEPKPQPSAEPQADVDREAPDANPRQTDGGEGGTEAARPAEEDKVPMQWKCEKGHTFLDSSRKKPTKAAPKGLCPECMSSKIEAA